MADPSDQGMALRKTEQGLLKTYVLRFDGAQVATNPCPQSG